MTPDEALEALDLLGGEVEFTDKDVRGMVRVTDAGGLSCDTWGLGDESLGPMPKQHGYLQRSLRTPRMDRATLERCMRRSRKDIERREVQARAARAMVNTTRAQADVITAAAAFEKRFKTRDFTKLTRRQCLRVIQWAERRRKNP